MDRADSLAEHLGTTQALKNAFDPILNVIVLALDAPAVFVRTKALRALSHILAIDSNVLTKVRGISCIGVRPCSKLGPFLVQCSSCYREPSLG